MPPGVNTALSSQTNSTLNTSVTTDVKSLRGFELDEKFHSSLEATCTDNEANKYDFWLLSVSKNFPSSCLADVPLVSNTTIPIDIQLEGNVKNYICESKMDGRGSEAIIIPSGSGESTFNCKKIHSSVCLREKVLKGFVNFSNCIQRPPPPSITAGLKERLKPIGWNSHNRVKTETCTAAPTEQKLSNVAVAQGKKKSKKRKKEKKKHEHDQKEKKHKRKKRKSMKSGDSTVEKE